MNQLDGMRYLQLPRSYRYYRSTTTFTYDDAALYRHFLSRGEPDGRAGSHACRRRPFARYADAHSSVLEIGPFCNPVLRGTHVRYFDVLSTEGLIARASSLGMRSDTAPWITRFANG